jgi:hypothetical protein
LQIWQRYSVLARTVVAFALVTLAAPAAAGAWSWPVPGPVLQVFDFDQEDSLAPGQHRGIDIQGPFGGLVLAPTAGTVTFAGRVAANGLTITIETVDGYAVTLLHLGSFLVAKGAVVTEGQPVAIVGTSGVPAHPVPYVQLGIRLLADPQGYRDPEMFLPPLAAPPVPSEPPAPEPEPAPLPVPPVPGPAPAPTTPPALPPLRAADPVDPVEPRPVPELLRPAEPSASDPKPSAPVSAPWPATRPVAEAPHAPAAPAPTPGVDARPAPLAGVEHASQPVSLPEAAPWLREPDPDPAVDGVVSHGRPFFWKVLAAAVLLLAALTAAAEGLRRAARIIEGDELLLDNTDLLRELEPAHRARVHDDRGRRARPAPQAARRGDLLPHGH